MAVPVFLFVWKSEKHVNARGGYYEGIPIPSSYFYILEARLADTWASQLAGQLLCDGFTFNAKVSCGQQQAGKWENRKGGNSPNGNSTNKDTLWRGGPHANELKLLEARASDRGAYEQFNCWANFAADENWIVHWVACRVISLSSANVPNATTSTLSPKNIQQMRFANVGEWQMDMEKFAWYICVIEPGIVVERFICGLESLYFNEFFPGEALDFDM